MQISISEAKAHLTELVRRAEAGDDVVLTRHGKAAVRLVAVMNVASPNDRREVMQSARNAAMKALSGESAARSQDFLYDDDGIPK